MSNVVKSYLADSSVGVDGDREGDFGFITNTQEHAWWQIDLGAEETIGEIVFYKMKGQYSKNAIPFDVLLSQDGKNWFLMRPVEKNEVDNCWRVSVPGIKARFVHLQTRLFGLLALSEVEIYR